MKKKIRWGILGCGKIANKFASDLQGVEDAELVAVASRDADRGKTFAKQFSVHFNFNTYKALASCDDVDVIYIATPHGFHYEHTMLCLQHAKAVLCEKPMAINTKQVKDMIDMAIKKKVFLMEAFWTKFLPQYQKMIELIQVGKIGTIKIIEADFGFKAPHPKPQRLYDVTLGGGALLDIGIYPVFLALSLLGRPNELHAMMSPYDSGVDEQIAMTLKFNNGALAMLNASFAADTPVEAIIIGADGYIRMSNRFHNATSKIELVVGKQQSEEIKVYREQGYGYQFEARHVGECLRAGLTESPIMRFTDSLLLIETLDRLRTSAGIIYSVD